MKAISLVSSRISYEGSSDEIFDIDDKASSVEFAELEKNSPAPFKITRAIPFIFEAIPPTINKSTALLDICKLLSVDPEKVLVFGDGDNDVPMFRVAGHSVAMANGMGSAKATAKYITSSNDEGGVGEFIEKVWAFE